MDAAGLVAGGRGRRWGDVEGARAVPGQRRAGPVHLPAAGVGRPGQVGQGRRHRHRQEEPGGKERHPGSVQPGSIVTKLIEIVHLIGNMGTPLIETTSPPGDHSSAWAVLDDTCQHVAII